MPSVDGNRVRTLSPRAQSLVELLRLAFPVTIAQVGMMAMGIVDTMMVGGISVTALDAAALGHVWTFGTSIPALGLVMGITPVVSQAEGAGRPEQGVATMLRGLVLALILCIPLAIAWLFTTEILVSWGQDQVLAELAGEYVAIQIPSLPALMIAGGLREWMQSRGVVWRVVVVMVAANLANWAFNLVLIHGWHDFEGLGLAGAAWATALSRIVVLVGLGVIAWRAVRSEAIWPGWSSVWARRSAYVQILGIGLPIGIQYSLEVWAFQISSLLAGRLGHTALAAHTIVLNISSLTFMAAMGISVAASTRVGQELGAGRPKMASLSAWQGLASGALFMGVAAIGLILGRRAIPGFYTSDAAAVGLAAELMVVAAAFQVFDGLQCVGGGVLRGMGQPRPAALANLAAYYIVALPLAWVLAFRFGLGAEGIWWGLCIGLALVSTSLCFYLRKRGPHHARRLELD